MAPPMERLAVEPEVPYEFEQGPWARIERRVALALMKALPESIRSVATRSTGSIAILFAAVFRIFPGGWERELGRIQGAESGGRMDHSPLKLEERLGELNIQVPDPVLLVASLDKFAVVLAKTSTEVAFRLQVGRAALQVNLVPTMQGVERFTQVLLAEGEAARHMVCRGANIEAKVRALDIDNGNSDGRRGKTDSENRGGESATRSSRRAVILPMEAWMDLKVTAEVRGVKSLMPHRVRKVEVVERTMKEP